MGCGVALSFSCQNCYNCPMGLQLYYIMVHSDIDTSCSSGKNDTLTSVMSNDAIRYRRKGYGLIFAFALAVICLYFIPELQYLLWPYYLQLASEKYLYVSSMLLTNLGVLLMANLMMLAIYRAKLPFFERYKILNKPWPWQEDPEKWKQVLKKTLKQLFVNVVVVQSAALTLDIYLGLNNLKFSLESFPSKWTIMWNLAFFMMMEDLLFYLSHSVLHKKQFYWIHKQHHEFNMTVSIAAEYCHPVEFFFANLLPTAMGFKMLSIFGEVHMATIMLWTFIRVWETSDGHCGYEWSWSVFRLLPLSGSAEYHNFHHSHNVGNFGSFFTYWDSIFGTNKHYFQYKSRKEREEYLNRLRLDFEEKKKELSREVIAELSD